MGRRFFVAIAAFYLAVTVLPLIEVAATFFIAPLISTALAAMVLREKVTKRHWAAVAFAFVGTILIVRPGIGVFQPASLIALGAAIFYACNMVLARKLGETETAGTTSYYTSLCYLVLAWISTGAIGLLGPFDGTAGELLKPWVQPSLPDLGQLLICGLLVAIGTLCATQALRVAPLSKIAPLEYTSLLWAGALSFLIWGELPTSSTLVGIILIVAGGIYVVKTYDSER